MKQKPNHDTWCIRPFLYEVDGYDDDIYKNKNENRTVHWKATYCRNCSYYVKKIISITKHA